MPKLLVKLGQSSAFYTFANSIEALSPFLLAIILTRILAPAEYGSWVLFIALVTFFRPLVNFTLQDALRMHYYEMNREELARFVWSCFCLATFSTVLIIVTIHIFKAPLGAYLQLPPEWLAPVAVTAYFFANFYFLLAYNQFAQKKAHFLILHILQAFAGIALISAFVLNGWSWSGVVVGKVLGLMAAFILGTLWICREVPIANALKQPPKLAELTKFGLIYLPTGMGLVAIPLTDRVIVTQVLGLSANGFYGVAALFGVAVFVAINGMIYAWTPWLFKQLKRWPESRKNVLLVSTYFCLLMPLGGIAAYLISIPIAPIVIGDQYHSAFNLIPWAIAGTVAMGFFFHCQAFLLFKKAIWVMSASSFTCIVSNAVFSYFGAYSMGLKGVFAATVGAFMLSAAISFVFTVLAFRDTKPQVTAETVS